MGLSRIVLLKMSASGLLVSVKMLPKHFLVKTMLTWVKKNPGIMKRPMIMAFTGAPAAVAVVICDVVLQVAAELTHGEAEERVDLVDRFVELPQNTMITRNKIMIMFSTHDNGNPQLQTTNNVKN